MNQAKKILKEVFGYKDFRENQKTVIQAILAGQDVFTSMPTGGGKSLCYQIPGLIFEGLTVIISPLIALMKDQVDDALAKGISAAFLNSTLGGGEVTDIYRRLYRGEIKLLYLSPERLALEGYFEKLQDLGVAFFAVDEAHCLSEWGHDFRPDYLVLSKIRTFFPTTPLAAFTATATPRVQKDIIRILHLHKPITVRASFNRKELYYQVTPKADVLKQIGAFVRDRPGDPGIIYRTSRKDVDETAEYLQAQGISALAYHAGMSKDERATNQEQFLRDQVQVVVATIAFGMGINKSNIRFVLHGDLPKSMEGYYQETGRAGRDGLDATCVLYYSPGDIARQQYFIEQIPEAKEQERSRKNLAALVHFATTHRCRRQQILAYFDETFEGNCGTCDVCTARPEDLTTVDGLIDAQKILSALARTNESFGATHIIDIVWGADTEKIRTHGHKSLKTYGVGRDKDRQWWRLVVQELLSQRAIFQDHEHYNVLKMTDLGRQILYGKAPFSMTRFTPTNSEGARRKKITLENGANPALVEVLKKTRRRLAAEHGVPPYIVFSDKTLQDMALLQPQTEEEFLLVSGVGERKLEVYGAEFLRAIREWERSKS